MPHSKWCSPVSEASGAARGVPPAVRSSARAASPVRLLNIIAEAPFGEVPVVSRVNLSPRKPTDQRECDHHSSNHSRLPSIALSISAIPIGTKQEHKVKGRLVYIQKKRTERICSLPCRYSGRQRCRNVRSG